MRCKDLLSYAYTGKVHSPYAGAAFPSVRYRAIHTRTLTYLWMPGYSATACRRAKLTASHAVKRSYPRLVSQPACLDHWTGWSLPITLTGMGMVGDIAAGKPELLAYEQKARWNKGLEAGGDEAVNAALDLITTFSQAKMDPKMFALYSPDSKLYKNLWERVIDDRRRPTTQGVLPHSLASKGAPIST